MTKEELDKRLLLFEPEILFTGTIGGIKLVAKVDAFKNCINWLVYEFDNYKSFDNFKDACDYYLEIIGE